MDNSELKEVLDEVARKGEEALAERRVLLEQAKEEADDRKESFDIERFGELYNLAGDFGPELSPKDIERLEMEYYLDNRDCDTLEEFAKRKIELRRHDAG